MKRNLLLSALFFSLSLLCAQANLLDFSFFGSDASRNLENNLRYQMSPFKASLLRISAQNLSEERLNFSQSSRNSLLGLDLAFDRGLLRHTLLSGYEYLYDSSELDAEFQPYRNKTGFLGYTLDLMPADSLLFQAGAQGYVRSEEDRYLLGSKLNSKGYLVHGRAAAGTELWNTRGGLSASYERKLMDWEYYQSGSLAAWLNHQSRNLLFNNSFSLSRRDDDIYVLLPDEAAGGRGFYDLDDSQQISSLIYSGTLEYEPWEIISLSLQESFSKRITDLAENTVRNNSDLLNQASLLLELKPMPNLGWSSTFSHSYGLKRFSNTQNSRHTENRFLATGLDWEYTAGDTLSAGFTVDLQRSSFPDDGNRWDNDLRHIRLNLSNAHYWKDRLKLSNRLYWSLTDDVYLDGLLSGNNKQTSSYVYNPELALLIGDRLLFNQNYLVRADYTGYMYDPDDKAFYRQLELEYKLVFDSFPLAPRSQDQRWMLLPFRNAGENALLADLSFGFERNEYADFNGQIYVINFKNTRYTAAATLKHDIRQLYYIIQPRYSWGTWKEYSLLFGLAWKFTDSSLLEFSLNPVGDSLDNLDWRSSVSLGARF
ncbi:MAG: hypothetical protein WCR92_08425 [Candidatus Cloacimonadaceae bacterium]